MVAESMPGETRSVLNADNEPTVEMNMEPGLDETYEQKADSAVMEAAVQMLRRDEGLLKEEVLDDIAEVTAEAYAEADTIIHDDALTVRVNREAFDEAETVRVNRPAEDYDEPPLPPSDEYLAQNADADQSLPEDSEFWNKAREEAQTISDVETAPTVKLEHQDGDTIRPFESSAEPEDLDEPPLPPSDEYLAQAASQDQSAAAENSEFWKKMQEDAATVEDAGLAERMAEEAATVSEDDVPTISMVDAPTVEDAGLAERMQAEAATLTEDEIPTVSVEDVPTVEDPNLAENMAAEAETVAPEDAPTIEDPNLLARLQEQAPTVEDPDLAERMAAEAATVEATTVSAEEAPTVEDPDLAQRMAAEAETVQDAVDEDAETVKDPVMAQRQQDLLDAAGNALNNPDLAGADFATGLSAADVAAAFATSAMIDRFGHVIDGAEMSATEFQERGRHIVEGFERSYGAASQQVKSLRDRAQAVVDRHVATVKGDIKAAGIIGGQVGRVGLGALGRMWPGVKSFFGDAWKAAKEIFSQAEVVGDSFKDEKPKKKAKKKEKKKAA